MKHDAKVKKRIVMAKKIRENLLFSDYFCKFADMCKRRLLRI